MKILTLKVKQLLLLFFCILMLFSCKKESIESVDDISIEKQFQITDGIKALIREKLTTIDYNNIKWSNTIISEVPNSELDIIKIEFNGTVDSSSREVAFISLKNKTDFLHGQIVKIKANSFDSLGQINGTYYEANLDRSNEEYFDLVGGFKIVYSISQIHEYPSIYVTLANWYILLSDPSFTGTYYNIDNPPPGAGGGGCGACNGNGSGGTGNNAPPATTYTFLSLFLTNQLQLNVAQKDWLNTHPTLAMDIFDALGNDEMPVGNIPAEEKQASKITIDAAMAGQIDGTYDVNHFNNYVAPNLTPIQTPTIIIPNYLVNFLIQCAEIREEHPGWSNARVYWHATVELLHNALDIVGMVPGAGEIADLANGVIYTIQGDGVNASFSYAAAIPIYGWVSTSAKWAKKTITALNGTRRTLKWFKQADGSITFGNRNLLRKVLGLPVGDLRVAHHLIPWSLSSHPLVQKAAGAGFHLNHYLNGIPLSAIQHNSGGHLAYNTKVSTYLQNQINNYQGGINAITNTAAENILNILNNQIRTWIINNPGVSINNIVL
jgi:hypothetical protein